MRKRLLILFPIFSCVVFSFSGCKKEQPVSTTPSIKFISLTPSPAKKYQDQIQITIEYTDGDGDLGENTPDVKNLFCTDSRNGVTYEYRIRQLAPDNANIIINGKLTFSLAPQGFIDDNYIFTSNIQILDRTTDINKLIKYKNKNYYKKL